MNSLNLLAIEAIICLTLLPIIYKKYKIEGLYIYTIVSLVLSFMMSLKIVSVYGYDANLGIIPFITAFTSSNIIIQKKGVEETKKYLLTIIGAVLISYFIFLLVSFMNSSNISNKNLFTSASYDYIFRKSLRIYFANIVTLLYGLLLNNKLYYYLKVMKNNILISNLFSTIIIQFIASIIFCLVGYVFVLDTVEIIKIIMIRYLISLVIGILSTIVIYITKFIKEEEK